MPRLRGATVSNRIVNKRKRKQADDTTAQSTASAPLEDESSANIDPALLEGTTVTGVTTVIVPLNDAAESGAVVKVKGSKRRAMTTSKKPPTLSRRPSSANLVTTTLEIPQYFKDLIALHKSLNLIYTFCCTRKQLATTFETIRSAVETSTKKKLTVDDIAQIKFLRPDSVLFAYVSEEELQIYVGDSNSKKWKEDVYTNPEDDDTQTYGKKKNKMKTTPEFLLFEFIDSELKRKFAPRKPGEPPRRLRDEDLKMPEYSQAQMTNLIKKRNDKFSSAVHQFLNDCHDSGLDPVKTLKNGYKPYVPDKVDAGIPAELPLLKSAVPAQVPVERKSISEIVIDLTIAEFYYSQIVPNGTILFPPQEAVYGLLDFKLSQALVNALYNTRNITQLFSHQTSALNDLYAGHDVIVSTSTSSGKSLIYQIPVLHELESNPDSRAIYIFPTKALAQDQKKSLAGMVDFMADTLGPILVETYDGDTPMESRRHIRDEARVIFTNPDMLHINVLPNEEQWRTFMKNLRFVVVDELHVYNGLFGSHMAFIMRRLRRICAAVGNSKVRFISCSATVANPEEHMKTIFGVKDVKLTCQDGSPTGLKTFLCWNCPYRDPKDASSGRIDPVFESAKIFVELILRGVRTIAFCRVRKVCELMVTAVKNELIRIGRQEICNKVMSYRGGYTPQDRRRIEREMFEGRLFGIVATNALELGVDIGTLDAVIMVGFPYTISNLRQQSGRAGRRNRDSLSILVGDSFPTDQYYMSNPELIISMPNPALQVDLENILILEGHIQCAAFEMPIKPDEDAKYFGSGLEKLAKERLLQDEQGWYHCNDRFRPYPSKHVAIRDTEDGHFAVVDVTNGRNIVLEEVEPSRAIFTIYEGGIFLHQGYKYLVKEFSPEEKLAKVEVVNVEWTTQQRDYTDIDPIETEQIRQLPKSPHKAFYGAIKIRAVVYGYFKLDKKRRILDACEIECPPLEIFSKGMWLDVPSSALEILNIKRLNVAGAIHAAEHAVISLLPNFVMSTPGDVRTECKVPEKEFLQKESSRKRPARLTFYDAKGGAGGSGISTKAFEFIDLLLRMAITRVEACGCEGGCPECVCSERCKGANAVLSKAGSSVILKSLLDLPIDIDALPEGPEEESPAMLETVVPATTVRARSGAKIDVVMIKREFSTDSSPIKEEPAS